MAGIKISTCSLDPVPSNLVKDCLPAISPLISNTINSSFSYGFVPQILKLVAVTPILKKPGLNPDVTAIFQPISNLPSLSKTLEHDVATQLPSHLTSNALFEPFQSGFRSHLSTETALLRVTKDVLLSVDSGHLTILLLLDLTAAFDTICHAILLSRLESSLYITGVPQSLVLGPLLFIMHTLPLGNIIHHHGLHFHLYCLCYVQPHAIDNKTAPDSCCNAEKNTR